MSRAPALQQEKPSFCNEKPEHRSWLESSLHSPELRKACAQEPKLGRITHHHQAAWDLGRFSASGIKGLQLRGSRGIDCQLGSEGRSSSKLGSDLQDMEDLE